MSMILRRRKWYLAAGGIVLVLLVGLALLALHAESKSEGGQSRVAAKNDPFSTSIPDASQFAPEALLKRAEIKKKYPNALIEYTQDANGKWIIARVTLPTPGNPNAAYRQLPDSQTPPPTDTPVYAPPLPVGTPATGAITGTPIQPGGAR